MKTFIYICLAAMVVAGVGRAAESGDAVVVVYNLRLPESKQVAEHYAKVRKVPAEQVIGLRLPTGETMTRAEFRDDLQGPLWKQLEKRKLFTLRSVTRGDELSGNVVASKIRYAVLCYGVPLKIDSDPGLVEELPPGTAAELRRNEAAVDAELALLPLSGQRLRLGGPWMSKFYGVTNTAPLHPTNGVLMVARLDGPTPKIAEELVDRAVQAETDGLWGRAYFDLRGLGEGEYKKGDDWISGAAKQAQRHGYETVIDDKPGVLSAGFPMSQVALYAGWYEFNVAGAWARPEVEVMPGAIAYHLHSFSAATLRSTNQNWVGPLLARGVTATMGCVQEPYLDGTPDVATFFHRMLFSGFTFGEAAYAAQRVLSWQTTVVGDPLYQPFTKPPQQLHEELEKGKSPLVAWSHLRVVNLNLVSGLKPDEIIKYLGGMPMTRQSSVLSEKLGDMLAGEGRTAEAADAYVRALRQPVTPLQRMRLLLELADKQTAADREDQALDTYQEFIKRYPEHPDLLPAYQKALPLADKLGKAELAARFRIEIKRLTSK
jgi:uncharacterized protein (TIGR03790 family)